MSAAESFAATGQEMFVDGEWRHRRAPARPPKRSSPATGEMIATVPQGDRADARARSRRPTAPSRAWAAPDRVRARRRNARRRRRDRAPARRPRAHAHARPGQAAARRGLRRGRRAGRVLARGGRGRQAPRRRAAELVLARQARDAGAPPARRGRDHHARGTGRTRCRPSCSLRRSLAATPSCGRPRHRPRSARSRWPVHRRGRPAPRRVQPRHRPGAGGRRRDRPQPRHRTGSRSSARPRPGGSSPQAAAGKAACSRWAATARSS